MNHEQQPPRGPHDPYGDLPEHLRPGPQAEHVIQHTLMRLTALEDEQRVVEGYLSHGTSFAAFLRLHDIAAQDPTLVERFRDVYADSWETMQQLTTDELDALGWNQAITEFRTQNGIDIEFLDWNWAAFEAHLHEVYSIVELDGWFHVFYR
ncbi:hypothetical protein [Microbacterium lacticum]